MENTSKNVRCDRTYPILNTRMLRLGCPGNIHLHNVNNRKTRKMCEICSKLKTKTPERKE